MTAPMLQIFCDHFSDSFRVPDCVRILPRCKLLRLAGRPAHRMLKTAFDQSSIMFYCKFYWSILCYSTIFILFYLPLPVPIRSLCLFFFDLMLQCEILDAEIPTALLRHELIFIVYLFRSRCFQDACLLYEQSHFVLPSPVTAMLPWIKSS